MDESRVPGIIFLCVLFSSKRHRWNKQQDLFCLCTCVYFWILNIHESYKMSHYSQAPQIKLKRLENWISKEKNESSTASLVWSIAGVFKLIIILLSFSCNVFRQVSSYHDLYSLITFWAKIHMVVWSGTWVSTPTTITQISLASVLVVSVGV